ncbi:hypothetical protein Afil01_65130 [Actinorhabdospora filicis]|uniref:Uncharacterized protein n=1 Tax=Actinorhabdospora filicis TaxID=1785913 RepID=A0A9W6SSL4_9ACTN|nr:hypothetical protein Afil01_65130 [Actinorhabdospora filicis]
MRSPFDLNNPPPEEGPVGVICPGLWTVQVRWWKRHTPRQGEKTCSECGQSWPCHSWLCWDGQIGDAIEASERFKRDNPQTPKTPVRGAAVARRAPRRTLSAA